MLTKTAKDIFLRPDLSRSEKVVYFALSTFTDRQNICFPSHDSIAKRAAYSVTTVKRALARLRELGLVVWQHCFDRDRARLKNRYTVSEPSAEAKPQPKAEDTPPLTIGRFALPVYEAAKDIARQVRQAAASFFTPRHDEYAMDKPWHNGYAMDI